MPPEHVQLSVTPWSGEEALTVGFETFKLFRRVAKQHGRTIQPSSSVLEFGCGWGRIIRYFWAVEDLWGIDVRSDMVEACRETIPFGEFSQVDPLGPAPFEDQRFDLVYAYSVFTHLSEESHFIWLEEIKRILKPGGLLIATTLGRKFLHLENPPDESEAPEFFSEESRAAFDRGEYVYAPTWNEHYGLAGIPESYIRERWPFEVLDVFPAVGQIGVVCR